MAHFPRSTLSSPCSPDPSRAPSPAGPPRRLRRYSAPREDKAATTRLGTPPLPLTSPRSTSPLLPLPHAPAPFFPLCSGAADVAPPSISRPPALFGSSDESGRPAGLCPFLLDRRLEFGNSTRAGSTLRQPRAASDLLPHRPTTTATKPLEGLLASRR